ncbi:MAG: hypothetical protein ACLTS1_13355 [Coprococcus sp.]
MFLSIIPFSIYNDGKRMSIHYHARQRGENIQKKKTDVVGSARYEEVLTRKGDNYLMDFCNGKSYREASKKALQALQKQMTTAMQRSKNYSGISDTVELSSPWLECVHFLTRKKATYDVVMWHLI